jgi:hypothetical protein
LNGIEWMAAHRSFQRTMAATAILPHALAKLASANSGELAMYPAGPDTYATKQTLL